VRGREHLEDLGIDGNIKWIERNRHGRCLLDSSGSGRIQWLAIVNAVIDAFVSWATISFSRTVLHGVSMRSSTVAHSSPVRKTDELNWKSISNKPVNQYSAFDQFTSHSRCNNQHAVCFTTWNVRAASVRNRKPSVQRKRKKNPRTVNRCERGMWVVTFELRQSLTGRK
jgi:hypothetical protein